MQKICIIGLVASLCFLACQDGPKQASAVKTVKAEMKNKADNKDSKPGMIHTVFFWLKEGVSEADKKGFESGIVTLGTVPSIKEFYWGPPSATEERGVIDASYAYALNVHFETVEKQYEYQVDPIHLEFIKKYEHLWEKVIVYDNDIK